MKLTTDQATEQETGVNKPCIRTNKGYARSRLSFESFHTRLLSCDALATMGMGKELLFVICDFAYVPPRWQKA